MGIMRFFKKTEEVLPETSQNSDNAYLAQCIQQNSAKFDLILNEVFKKHFNASEIASTPSKDELELFSEKLILENPRIALDVLGYHAQFMIGIGLGWHYLLDLIWVIKKLRSFGRPLHILDAGGNVGLLQFILAREGHSVVSVDAFYRDKPEQCGCLIPIHLSGSKQSVQTDYVKRVPEDYKAEHDLLSRIIPAPGEIEFHCANLTDMPLINDNEFDAVVSISALEHNSREDLAPILKEIYRVTKPNAPLLFTLSTSFNNTPFHEPSHSYLYSEKELIDIYQLGSDVLSNFTEIKEYKEMLYNSVFLKSYLSSFYYRSDKSGMPNGIWEPSYLPFGLFKLNKK